jgi:hypothetical protein
LLEARGTTPRAFLFQAGSDYGLRMMETGPRVFGADALGTADVTDDYLAGFIDGEGMFHVGIVPSRYTRLGWQVIYLFKVAQNPIGEPVLRALQARLACGVISPNARTGSRDRTLKFVVRDLPSLVDKVVPYCDGRLVVKRDALQSFKEVLDRVRAGRHLTSNGLLEIVDTAYAMNTKTRRVPRSTIEAAIRARGLLAGRS